jgi:putative ABC transport system permease protein
MNIALKKIRGDLRQRPGRTLLMGLAVLVGTAAVTAALVAMTVLGRAIPDSFGSSLPPSAILATGDQTEAALELLQDAPGVIAVEPRRILRGRIATPDGFASLALTILPDLTTQEVSRIAPDSDDPQGLLIERSSLTVWGGVPGDAVTLRLQGADEISLLSGGTAADAAVAPGVQDRVVYAYATPTMVGALGTFDELRLRLEPGALPTVLDTLQASGITPDRVEEPLMRHPHADQMQAVMMLLAAFAVAALIVAGALVANLVSVTLRGEERLIGIQKAIGSSRARVVLTVLGWVAAIALPATVLGIAAGLVAVGRFNAFAAHELNLADLPLAPSPAVLVLAAVIGVTVPLLAAALMARRAAGVAPLAAIHSGRDIAPVRAPRQSGTAIARAYAVRYLGRTPLRLALMLLALSLGGAAVMTAGTVYRSLSASVDRVFDYRGDDLDLRMLTPAPREVLAEAARAEGVTEAEVWGFAIVAIASDDSRITGSRFGLNAPPQDSTLLQLPVAEGRWLGEPGAAEIVAARSLLVRYPDLAVGSEVTLARGEWRATATIVGAIEEATEPGIYATAAVHDALVGVPGLAGALRVTTSGDPAEVAGRIEDRLFADGLVPIFVFDKTELRFSTKEHFVILLILLSTVGAAALVVGGLSLWSSISVAILERQRDIAVIRSVGGSNDRVIRLFGLESAGLAGLALILSVGIALPLSALLVRMLGQGALFMNVPLQFSWTSLLIWLVLLALIAVIATWAPLARALAVPPARALRYE